MTHVYSTLPHNAPWTPPGAVTEVHHCAFGYYVENMVVTALLTPSEFAAFQAEEAEMAAYTEAGNAFHDGEDFPVSCFPTVELALEAAAVEDAIHGVGEELAAFHAPSECGQSAYRHLHAEQQRLERLATVVPYSVAQATRD